jgi:hypothetical protein
MGIGIYMGPKMNRKAVVQAQGPKHRPATRHRSRGAVLNGTAPSANDFALEIQETPKKGIAIADVLATWPGARVLTAEEV